VAAAFGAQVDVRNGVARLALSGELDMSTAPVLDEYLGLCQADGVRAVIVDLRDLSFVDSSGLGAFLRARNDAEENGHRLYLIGAPRTVRGVFEVTETEFLLDEPEAIGLLDRFTGDGAVRA
jgi:anti-sigma B factor antagonist